MHEEWLCQESRNEGRLAAISIMGNSVVMAIYSSYSHLLQISKSPKNYSPFMKWINNLTGAESKERSSNKFSGLGPSLTRIHFNHSDQTFQA